MMRLLKRIQKPREVFFLVQVFHVHLLAMLGLKVSHEITNNVDADTFHFPSALFRQDQVDRNTQFPRVPVPDAFISAQLLPFTTCAHKLLPVKITAKRTQKIFLSYEWIYYIQTR